jgi:hypothetical protein
MDIFNFNHISQDLSKDDKETLIKLYAYYHRKTNYYKSAFKHLKKLKIVLNITSIGLTVIGTIAGAITLNPIVLAAISGPGIIIQGFLRITNYERKIEMCKFAYTSYQKMLNKIRGYLRGEQYILHNINAELEWLDDIIIDFCQIVDKYKEKYNKKYKSNAII